MTKRDMEAWDEARHQERRKLIQRHMRRKPSKVKAVELRAELFAFDARTPEFRAHYEAGEG